METKTARKTIAINLDASQVSALKRLAGTTGLSISYMARKAFDSFLAAPSSSLPSIHSGNMEESESRTGEAR